MRLPLSISKQTGPYDGQRDSPQTDGQGMKSCKLCKYSRICNDLPGICILLPYLAIAVVVVSLGYLFVTQELI